MNNKPERVIQSEVRLAASDVGYILWRNNVGVGYQGEIAIRAPDYITINNPRRVIFGLTEGASDLIGYKSVTITPEMVGQTVAVFTAIEVKSATGRATKKQKHFLSRVQQDGGISVLARSPRDLP